MPPSIGWIIGTVVVLVVIGVAAFFSGIQYRRRVSEREISSAEEEATRIINEAIKSAESKKREALLEGLSRTRALIAQAYSGFNSARDPDLIESYVFEINALQARYTYLLRRVKELDG